MSYLQKSEFNLLINKEYGIGPQTEDSINYYRMITQIARLFFWPGIFFLFIPTVLAQDYSSRNNYTGNWETPTSWNPTWPVPQTNVNSLDITINGYITANSSLTFSEGTSKLIVEDTLVIKGNLTIDDNNDVQVNNNGILIVWGDLTLTPHSKIEANNYIIVTGNLIKEGSPSNGEFKSDDNPVRVFIGGTISPADLTDNQPDFTALDCTSPPTTPYPHTGCSYGDLTDIMNDPIYAFFLSTCSLPAPTISASGPTTFCSGGNVTLTSSAGFAYLWSNNETTPVISATTQGIYSVKVKNESGCESNPSSPVMVTVNALPIATAGNNGPVCVGSAINLIGGPAGMTSYSWNGANLFSSSSQSPTISTLAELAMSGEYTLTVFDANGCTNTAKTTVIVNQPTLLSITSSAAPLCINDLRTLTGSPTGGTFVINNGPGSVSNNILLASGVGNINLEYTIPNNCDEKAIQSLIVNSIPVANPGNDQELRYIFKTQMNAELNPPEIGKWNLISGSGNIIDPASPTSLITGLSIGDNVFLWKVNNGNCNDSANVTIKILDLIVPSVITPNNDGKNDFFKITEFYGIIELIILNKWGIEEYTNGNYKNDWNGRSNRGYELPNDTYFYLLKFENGIIKKGSVLIKR